MENYNEINEFIENSYKTQNFDLNYFEFYKTRKEKRNNSVGIIKWKDNKYFFKIVKDNEYNDEDAIKNEINPYFEIVEKYSEHKIGVETLNLYEYIDAPGRNAFNFLRDKNISFIEKDNKLNEFFSKKFEFMKKTESLKPITGNKKADRWFYDRIAKGSRFDTFYGENGINLIEDVKRYDEDSSKEYEKYFIELFKYLNEENMTVESYCHGDFHDFNFSLDGLFWDIDTFGMNPIMNDFAVYYWHYYGREDALIYKYSPWLVNYMYDSLNRKELIEVRNLKEKYILKWYDVIEKLYEKYNISHNITNEFVFKLFCRVFLIDNVLNYDEEDKKTVYKFFDYVLRNKDKGIRNILFTNPTKLVTEEV